MVATRSPMQNVIVDVDYYLTDRGYVGLERIVHPGEWGPIQIGRGAHWDENLDPLESVKRFIYGAHRKDDWLKVNVDDVPDDWYHKIGYGPPRVSGPPWWQVILVWLALGVVSLAIIWIPSVVWAFFTGL